MLDAEALKQKPMAELVGLINELLPEGEKVTKKTFKNKDVAIARLLALRTFAGIENAGSTESVSSAGIENAGSTESVLSAGIENAGSTESVPPENAGSTESVPPENAEPQAVLPMEYTVAAFDSAFNEALLDASTDFATEALGVEPEQIGPYGEDDVPGSELNDSEPAAGPAENAAGPMPMSADGLTDTQREAGYTRDSLGNLRDPEGLLVDEDGLDDSLDDAEPPSMVEVTEGQVDAIASAPPPVPEEPKQPAAPRAARAKAGNPTVRQRAEELLKWADPQTKLGHTYQHIMDTIRAEWAARDEVCHTSLNSIRWYVTDIQVDGTKLPDRPKKNKSPTGRKPMTSLVARILADKPEKTEADKKWLAEHAPDMLVKAGG